MKRNPYATRWRRLLARLAVAALAAAGCVIIPTPTTPVRDIPPESRESLRLGETRRADILMQYGEPALRIDGDRVLVYRWGRVRAIVVVWHLPPFLPVGDAEALFLEFGADGTLARLGTATAWKAGSIEELARAWSRGGSLLPQPK